MTGGADFGMGDGHDFSIKIPFTVTYRGENIPVKLEVDSNNHIRYYFEVSGNKWYAEFSPAFSESAEAPDPEGSNIFVSYDISVRAEMAIDDEEQYIRLLGTSYSGENPVKIHLALYITHAGGGVIPGFKTYTLIREGLNPPYEGRVCSVARTEIDGMADITQGEVGDVKFRVIGLRKATFATSSEPENAGASGTYYILDSEGREARVSNLEVVRFNGDYLKHDTT